MPGVEEIGGMVSGLTNFPSVDESFDRLHCAGWSVGEVATSGAWSVIGTNGENVLEARGQTQTRAWWRACEQARAVGMLGDLTRVLDR